MVRLGEERSEGERKGERAREGRKNRGCDGRWWWWKPAVVKSWREGRSVRGQCGGEIAMGEEIEGERLSLGRKLRGERQ